MKTTGCCLRCVICVSHHPTHNHTYTPPLPHRNPTRPHNSSAHQPSDRTARAPLILPLFTSFHFIMYFIIPQNTLTPLHPFTIYYWTYTTLHYHTNHTLHTFPRYFSFVPLVSRHSPLCLYRFHIAAYFIICYPTSRYNLLPMVRRNRE